MSRPRTFDESAVVDAAVDAFWHGGLGATSIEELQRATGLARSSLYNSFGSKGELVRRALDRYATRQMAGFERAFEGRTLREALERIFVDAATDNHAGRGCLLINSAGELRDADAEVLPALRGGFERLAARLAALVAASRPDMARPMLVATEIVGAIAGLRTLHRSGLPAELVGETARRFARCIATD